MTPELSPQEQERYEWQLWTPGFGISGQEKLKMARVLVSRCGGVGGTAALELAAAGIGHLVLAHAGELRLNDLNRQLLMTTDHVGKPRLDSAVRRLQELNPEVQVTAVPENLTADNAPDLVAGVDVVLSAAPLFEERLAMNAAAVRAGKPIIHAAMYDMEASVLVTLPGQTACLACVSPQAPDWWRREFPVFGAVAGTAGCMAAMEAIKLIANLGDSMAGTMCVVDYRHGRMKRLKVARDPHCPVCGG